MVTLRLPSAGPVSLPYRADAPIRILVADDHRLFAKTIAALLAGHADLELVGIAEDGRQAVELALQLDPDLVLMDLDMPVMDGLTATQRLVELRCRAYVLILTASHEPEHADRAFEVGAVGYLTKDRVATELVPAILEVGAVLSGPGDRLSADGGSELADQARV